MAKAKKLPSGAWRVRAYIGKDVDGKEKFKSFTASTKKEVEYLAARYLATQAEDDRPSRDLTLQQAYDRYINSKSNVLSPSTIREYKSAAKRDFPTLMPLPLAKLTQEKIQVAVNEMAISRSPKSVRNAHGLLYAVLRTYYPSLNLNTRLPQKAKKDISIPDEKDIIRLLAASEGTSLHVAIVLGAFGTLRRSEICALTQEDVLDTGIKVNKAMVYSDAKEWVIKTTKTAAGTRFVKLSEEVIALLRSQPSDLIYPFSPTTLTNGFTRFSERVLGRSFRFHDLRHFSASTLHAIGMADVYIMHRGGWECRDVLNNTYQHAFPEHELKENERVNAHFDSILSKAKAMEGSRA